MIRDFSMEKKDELYRNLDVIDNKEWKPFMIWCGGRAGEFGEWADKLGISSYTNQIDTYQNRVLDTNNSTRNQIDVIFENVAETDRRYAEILRECAENVKEQIARIQVMTEVMESACGIGLYNGIILFEMEQNSVSQRVEMILKGREILMRRLESEKNISLEERQRICDIIMDNQPNMLINLYITDCYSSADSILVEKAIIDFYNRYRLEHITIDDVEGLKFDNLPLEQIQKETFVECWNYLFAMGLTKDQVIATIANIYSEGALSPTNRENTNDNCAIEDPDYVYQTDDGVGYGILQWTFWSRKEGLQNKANEMGKEVSDLDVQLAYFQYEMEESYDFKYIWSDFRNIQERDEAIEFFYHDIERPKVSIDVNSEAYNNELSKRIGYADDIEAWYDATFN